MTIICAYNVVSSHETSYSYTIALSGLFELYARGGCLNHEAKPSDLNACLERTIHDKAIDYSVSGLYYDVKQLVSMDTTVPVVYGSYTLPI